MLRLARIGVLVAVTVALLVAGCGGDGDDSGNGNDNAAAAAGNERFTEAQWTEYSAAAATYDSTLSESRTVFLACQAGAVGGEELSQCVGAEVDKSVGAALEFQETLASYEGTVAGACSDALVQYTGSVKIHASTLNALDSTLESNSVAEISVAIDNAVLGREEVTTAADAFLLACEPV
jgi:hypothetical protein